MSSVEQWISSAKDYKDEVLELDEIKITKISPELKAELQKFKEVKRLSLVACDLKTLENFPVLEELEELDLTDNKIKGEELKNLPLYSNLKQLSLSSNPIGNVQDIKALVKFNKTLTTLLLDESLLAKNNKNYRKEVFQIIGGSVSNVDFEDREGKEIAEDSDAEGESDDEDDDDDVEEILNDEDDQEEERREKKPKTPQGSAKKPKNEQDDDEEDQDSEDDEDFEDEDVDSDDDDDDEDEEDSEPPKKVKRN